MTGITRRFERGNVIVDLGRAEAVIPLREQMSRESYRAGDRVQAFEVRLIQSLLFVFGDPDHYFGEFWARGVWLGSRERKLPRTPAVFDRKVKWKYSEPD